MALNLRKYLFYEAVGVAVGLTPRQSTGGSNNAKSTILIAATPNELLNATNFTSFITTKTFLFLIESTELSKPRVEIQKIPSLKWNLTSANIHVACQNVVTSYYVVR